MKTQSKSMERNDFIDLDEGYRPGEPIKAFHTHALPCESCGKPVDERKPATWDPDLMVGPCCEFDLSGIPDVPTCEGLYRAIMRCTTVREVEAAFTAHRMVCAFCRGEHAADLKEAA